MEDGCWLEVEEYVDGLLLPTDPALAAAREASDAAGLPAISVTPGQGKLLMLLAQAQGARSILELGTLGGYSTIWLARALPAGGRLVTLELEANYAEVARANIARAGLKHAVEIRVGAALESLQRMHEAKHEPFDFIFIDADKANYPDYLKWAVKLARPGSLIVADNVVRKGEVIRAESEDANVQGVRRTFEWLASQPALDATVVQTVGSKGYDGFALIRVREKRDD